MDTLAFDAASTTETTRNGFNRFWPMMAPPAIAKNEALRDEVWEKVKEGRAWLFLSAEAAVLVALESFPGLESFDGAPQHVRICFWGGRANAVNDLLEEVEVFARNRGCESIIMEAAPSDGRYLKGFEPIVVTLRRGLD